MATLHEYNPGGRKSQRKKSTVKVEASPEKKSMQKLMGQIKNFMDKVLERYNKSIAAGGDYFKEDYSLIHMRL